jgi:hypothetical protein
LPPRASKEKEDMKESYEDLVFEVIEFGAEDIIITSNPQDIKPQQDETELSG